VTLPLAGKATLITGASGSIGAGIAQVLASAGASIAAAYFPSADERVRAEAVAAAIVAQGGNAFPIPVDITDPSSVRAGVDQVIQRVGRLDILVNNAGVMQHSSGAETAPEDFDRCHTVNLKGAWIVTQACISHLKRSGDGRVINISSGAGRRGSPMIPAYAASKAATISLTQSLALMLAPDGVTANTVCPGIIWSSMCGTFFGLMDPAPPQGAGEETLLAWAREHVPLARPQTAEDVGHAVAFFASPWARNVTGQALNVDGGLMMN
jgi:NAD(P)-dependent dehydrogenase (short-subunit alcohol dehydrogenase family)